jgi:hypothetical protein
MIPLQPSLGVRPRHESRRAVVRGSGRPAPRRQASVARVKLLNLPCRLHPLSGSRPAVRLSTRGLIANCERTFAPRSTCAKRTDLTIRIRPLHAVTLVGSVAKRTVRSLSSMWTTTRSRLRAWSADYRVTLGFRNRTLATTANPDEQAMIRQLWPEQATFTPRSSAGSRSSPHIGIRRSPTSHQRNDGCWRWVRQSGVATNGPVAG